MNTKNLSVFILIISQFYIFPIFGQAKKDTTSLSEVIIKGSLISTSLQNSASSVSVIQKKDLDKSDGVLGDMAPTILELMGIDLSY